MKKLILISAFALAVSTASSASAANWFAGLLGGVNIADLTDIDETSMKTGFSGGGFVGADFSDGLSGRVEVLYTQKGTARNVNPEFGGQDTTVKLAYIDVPVLLVANLTKAFSVFGGPSFNYNISGEEELEDGSIVDYSDDIETLEIGLVLGAEFEHVRESMTVFLDTRLSLGLTGILENAASEYEGVKNVGFGILLGLKFPLGTQQ